MEHECCEQCRFFHPNPRIGADGDCRHGPPAVVVRHDCAGTWWPEVRATDWCGEFQPKDKPAESPPAKLRVNLNQIVTAKLTDAGMAEFQRAVELPEWVVLCAEAQTLSAPLWYMSQVAILAKGSDLPGHWSITPLRSNRLDGDTDGRTD